MHLPQKVTEKIPMQVRHTCHPYGVLVGFLMVFYKHVIPTGFRLICSCRNYKHVTPTGFRLICSRRNYKHAAPTGPAFIVFVVTINIPLQILLMPVLFGLSRGKLSSRKAESACKENIIFMALTCGQTSDHSTIAVFVSSMESLKKSTPRGTDEN